MEIMQVKSPKGTQSYADPLRAVGLADLIGTLPCYTGDVQIIDDGDSYNLQLTTPLNLDNLEHIEIEPGYPYIIFKNKDKENAPPDMFLVIDYEREKAKEEEFWEYEEARKKNKALQDMFTDENRPPMPRPDLTLLKIFNSLRANSPSYNNLHSALRKQSDLSLLVKNHISNTPITVAVKNLEKAASNLQLFNPIAGKGVHRPKPNGTGLGSINPGLVNWFDEWMKFRAMYYCMSAVRDKDTDDFKIYVLAPQNINLSALKQINRGLLQERHRGNIKTDIFMVMDTVELLINHCDAKVMGSVVRFRNNSPREIIAGLYQVLFKSMGTGRTVMNISFIGLPGWFTINSPSDADTWLAVFVEHKAIIRLMDEKSIIPEETELLQQYRDFISTGDFNYLLCFLAGYCSLVLRKIATDKPVRQFTVDNLRRVFMAAQNSSFNKIIETPGFQNIATAIRWSTVILQRKKAKKEKFPYEIRYGLSQDWKRKAKFQDQFTIALADFVQQYNYENNRVREQEKNTRLDISKQDLTETINLINEYGSEIVCMLLLAFGYAYDNQKKEEE